MGATHLDRILWKKYRAINAIIPRIMWNLVASSASMEVSERD